jgi:hypothetical protein
LISNKNKINNILTITNRLFEMNRFDIIFSRCNIPIVCLIILIDLVHFYLWILLYQNFKVFITINQFLQLFLRDRFFFYSVIVIFLKSLSFLNIWVIYTIVYRWWKIKLWILLWSYFIKFLFGLIEILHLGIILQHFRFPLSCLRSIFCLYFWICRLSFIFMFGFTFIIANICFLSLHFIIERVFSRTSSTVCFLLWWSHFFMFII